MYGLVYMVDIGHMSEYDSKKGDQYCQQHVAPRAEFPEMSPSHLKNLCFRLINNGR